MTRMQANPTELMAAVLAPAEEDWNEAGIEILDLQNKQGETCLRSTELFRHAIGFALNSHNSRRKNRELYFQRWHGGRCVPALITVVTVPLASPV